MNHIFGRLAIGCAGWGKLYNGVRVSVDEQKRILAYAQCSGIDTLDTAVSYEHDWTKVSSYFNVVVKVKANDILPEIPYCIMAHDAEAVPRTSHQKDSLWGYSVYETQQLNFRPDVIQLPYSIYDRRFEPFLGNLKKQEPIPEIHVRSIFLRGKILEKFKPWECIAFCLANPYVDRVIIGVDSLGQLKDNLRPFHRMNAAQVHDENILDPRKWKDNK